MNNKFYQTSRFLTVFMLLSQASSSFASEADDWSKAGFQNAVVTHLDMSNYAPLKSSVAPARGLSLTSVILRGTGWNEAEVTARTQLMVEALAPCGVKLIDLKLITADAPQGIIRYDGMVRVEPDYLDDPLKSEAQVTEHLPSAKRPILFYVQSFKTDFVAYANLAEAAPAGHQNSPVIDTIWISKATTVIEHKYNPDYSVEAHELGHVLGKLQHLYPPHLPGGVMNLMAADIRKMNSQLNAKQCEKIMSSPLLSPL